MSILKHVLTMTRGRPLSILGLKVKGQGHIGTLNVSNFRTITKFLFDFSHVLNMARGGPLFILGVKAKGQGHIRTLYCFCTRIPCLTYVPICSPWPTEDLYWLWDQKVKGKGQIWTLIFAPYPHNIMILHTCVACDLRRNPKVTC